MPKPKASNTATLRLQSVERQISFRCVRNLSSPTEWFPGDMKRKITKRSEEVARLPKPKIKGVFHPNTFSFSRNYWKFVPPQQGLRTQHVVKTVVFGWFSRQRCTKAGLNQIVTYTKNKQI